MEVITIQVPGEELENISIELNQLEVASIYKDRKALTQKVIELEKKIKDLESTAKYSSDRIEKAEGELKHGHMLFDALGVPAKTNEEESYYRKDLPISTRMALYIAANK